MYIDSGNVSHLYLVKCSGITCVWQGLYLVRLYLTTKEGLHLFWGEWRHNIACHVLLNPRLRSVFFSSFKGRTVTLGYNKSSTHWRQRKLSDLTDTCIWLQNYCSSNQLNCWTYFRSVCSHRDSDSYFRHLSSFPESKGDRHSSTVLTISGFIFSNYYSPYLQ